MDETRLLYSPAAYDAAFQRTFEVFYRLDEKVRERGLMPQEVSVEDGRFSYTLVGDDFAPELRWGHYAVPKGIRFDRPSEPFIRRLIFGETPPESGFYAELSFEIDEVRVGIVCDDNGVWRMWSCRSLNWGYTPKWALDILRPFGLQCRQGHGANKVVNALEALEFIDRVLSSACPRLLQAKQREDMRGGEEDHKDKEG